MPRTVQKRKKGSSEPQESWAIHLGRDGGRTRYRWARRRSVGPRGDSKVSGAPLHHSPRRQDPLGSSRVGRTCILLWGSPPNFAARQWRSEDLPTLLAPTIRLNPGENESGPESRKLR